MLIELREIAGTVGMVDENPLARQTWHALAMRRWREEWRAAEAAADYSAMDRLDRAYETIQGV